MTDNKPKQVVLPAAIYDTLELGAIAYGGIGALCLTQCTQIDKNGGCVEVPLCVIGLTLFLDGALAPNGGFSKPEVVALVDRVLLSRNLDERRNNRSELARLIPVTSAVAKAFGMKPEQFTFVYGINDGAVSAIFGVDDDDSFNKHERVTFKQWCKQLNVVRGPDLKPQKPRFPKNMKIGEKQIESGLRVSRPLIEASGLAIGL